MCIRDSPDSDPDDDDTEARRAEGRARKAQRELEEAQEKLRAVNSEIAQAEQQRQQQAATEPPADPPADPDTDPDDFAKDYPNYSGDIDARVKAEVDRQAASFTGTVAEQNQQITQLQNQLGFSEIARVHGDTWFKDMVESGEVDAYIAAASQYAQPEMDRIIKSGTAGEVSALLTDVKNAATETKAGDGDGEGRTNPKPPSQRRAGKSGSSRSAPPDNRGPDKGDFSGTFKQLEKERLAERDRRFGKQT